MGDKIPEKSSIPTAPDEQTGDPSDFTLFSSDIQDSSLNENAPELSEKNQQAKSLKTVNQNSSAESEQSNCETIKSDPLKLAENTRDVPTKTNSDPPKPSGNARDVSTKLWKNEITAPIASIDVRQAQGLNVLIRPDLIPIQSGAHLIRPVPTLWGGMLGAEYPIIMNDPMNSFVLGAPLLPLEPPIPNPIIVNEIVNQMIMSNALTNIPAPIVTNVVNTVPDQIPVPKQFVHEIIRCTSCTLCPPKASHCVPLTQAKPPGCKTIWCGGLPRGVTKEMIQEIFERFGKIIDLRMNKYFCHVRFEQFESVDIATSISGYRIYVGNSSDPLDSGLLFVDYSKDREDVREWECEQLRLEREKHHSVLPTSPPFTYCTEKDIENAAEVLKQKDRFLETVQVLTTWLDKGECDKENVDKLFSLIQKTNAHATMLQTERNQQFEELKKFRNQCKEKAEYISLQLSYIERLFASALQKKVWDHLTKAQRTNLEDWNAELLKNQVLNNFLNDDEDIDMELSDGEQTKESKGIFNKETLKEANANLQLQVRAYENEVLVLKNDHKAELESKDQDIKKLENALKSKSDQLINAQKQKREQQEREYQFKELQEKREHCERILLESEGRQAYLQRMLKEVEADLRDEINRTIRLEQDRAQLKHQISNEQYLNKKLEDRLFDKERAHRQALADLEIELREKEKRLRDNERQQRQMKNPLNLQFIDTEPKSIKHKALLDKVSNQRTTLANLNKKALEDAKKIKDLHTSSTKLNEKISEDAEKIKDLLTSRAMLDKKISEDAEQIKDLHQKLDSLAIQTKLSFTENETKLLAIISTFLLVHPFGIELDQIVAYVNRMDPASTRCEILSVLKRSPLFFEQENIEENWVLNLHYKSDTDDKYKPYSNPINMGDGGANKLSTTEATHVTNNSSFNKICDTNVTQEKEPMEMNSNGFHKLPENLIPQKNDISIKKKNFWSSPKTNPACIHKLQKNVEPQEKDALVPNSTKTNDGSNNECPEIENIQNTDGPSSSFSGTNHTRFDELPESLVPQKKDNLISNSIETSDGGNECPKVEDIPEKDRPSSSSSGINHTKFSELAENIVPQKNVIRTSDRPNNVPGREDIRKKDEPISTQTKYPKSYKLSETVKKNKGKITFNLLKKNDNGLQKAEISRKKNEPLWNSSKPNDLISSAEPVQDARPIGIDWPYKGFATSKECFRLARICRKFQNHETWSPQLRRRLQEIAICRQNFYVQFRAGRRHSCGVSVPDVTEEENRMFNGTFTIPDRYPEEDWLDQQASRQKNSSKLISDTSSKSDQPFTLKTEKETSSFKNLALPHIFGAPEIGEDILSLLDQPQVLENVQKIINLTKENVHTPEPIPTEYTKNCVNTTTTSNGTALTMNQSERTRIEYSQRLARLVFEFPNYFDWSQPLKKSIRLLRPSQYAPCQRCCFYLKLADGRRVKVTIPKASPRLLKKLNKVSVPKKFTEECILEERERERLALRSDETKDIQFPSSEEASKSNLILVEEEKNPNSQDNRVNLSNISIPMGEGKLTKKSTENIIELPKSLQEADCISTNSVSSEEHQPKKTLLESENESDQITENNTGSRDKEVELCTLQPQIPYRQPPVVIVNEDESSENQSRKRRHILDDYQEPVSKLRKIVEESNNSEKFSKGFLEACDDFRDVVRQPHNVDDISAESGGENSTKMHQQEGEEVLQVEKVDAKERSEEKCAAKNPLDEKLDVKTAEREHIKKDHADLYQGVQKILEIENSHSSVRAEESPFDNVFGKSKRRISHYNKKSRNSSTDDKGSRNHSRKRDDVQKLCSNDKNTKIKEKQATEDSLWETETVVMDTEDVGLDEHEEHVSQGQGKPRTLSKKGKSSNNKKTHEDTQKEGSGVKEKSERRVETIKYKDNTSEKNICQRNKKPRRSAKEIHKQLQENPKRKEDTVAIKYDECSSNRDNATTKEMVSRENKKSRRSSRDSHKDHDKHSKNKSLTKNADESRMNKDVNNVSTDDRKHVEKDINIDAQKKIRKEEIAIADEDTQAIEKTCGSSSRRVSKEIDTRKCSKDRQDSKKTQEKLINNEGKPKCSGEVATVKSKESGHRGKDNNESPNSTTGFGIEISIAMDTTSADSGKQPVEMRERSVSKKKQNRPRGTDKSTTTTSKDTKGSWEDAMKALDSSKQSKLCKNSKNKLKRLSTKIKLDMNRKTLESLQCSVGKHKKSSEAEKSNIISQYESSGESPEIRELSDNVVESPTEFECSSNEDDQLADTSLTKSSDTIEEVGPKIEIQESTLTVPKVEEEPEDLANVHQMPESHIKKEPNIDISEKVGEQESVEVQVKEEPEVDQIKKESDDVKDTLSVIQNTKPSRGEFEEFSRHAQDIRNELHELFGDPQEQTTPGPSEKPNFFCDTHWSSEDIQRLTKSIDKD